MSKVRKVIKTGNSLCVTLPTSVIKSFDIKEGDLAQYKIKSSKASITYTFSGHPRQLTFDIKK
jgi:antitoxin component of MazEF toxin-antitoxin module